MLSVRSSRSNCKSARDLGVVIDTAVIVSARVAVLCRAGFSDSLRKKGRALDIAPQVDTATAEALRYMARTNKQRRTYLPYTFPAVAGTHLPTPRGWRVE